ncbi:MAG: LON peptidase substrate-binding domain-containing protein, partial [Pseudomonadota bacterium]
MAEEIKTYPVLPLRDIVVFPHMVVPLFVGRDKSVRALETVMESDREILLVAQKDAGNDDPDHDDIYTIGVVAKVLQLLKLPDGTVKVLVEGGQRAEITRYTDEESFFEADAALLEEIEGDPAEIEALARSVNTQFESYVKLNKRVSPEVIVSIGQIDEASKLADTVASHLNLKIAEKQELLEISSIPQRLEAVYGFMEGEMSVLQVEKKIRGRVKRQMEKTQREYYLNEQMKAIQKELGEGEDGKDELGELEEKIEKTKLSKEAKTKAHAELKKLRQMSPMS